MRPGTSARHAAHRVARRRPLRLVQARCRLLRRRRAFGCLGTSHGSSSTTSPRAGYVARLVVDYFAHAARLVVSARRAAPRRVLHLAQARRRLLRPRCASGCLGMSHGSSSTNSPTSRVRVSRHVTRLVVDYFADAVHPGASARRAARRVAHRRPLRLAQAHR
jgi:hypothetical protein